jgi:uncharacterized membrane protein
MSFQFTHASWLWMLVPALAWVIWFALKSDVQLTGWRRWTSLGLRLLVLLGLIFALAGFQWLLPVEGMNVFYLLDRSDSIPGPQQEAAREWVNRSAKAKKTGDQAGVIVFGSEASIEFLPNPIVELSKVQAVVGTERSDLAGAIRLGTAALPETGQKRLVLVTDGNENVGDAFAATIAARQLGATVDILPLGVERGGDVSIQRLQAPSRLKRGQPFDVKIFSQSDRAREATVRLFRNEQLLGEQRVMLEPGKNLHSFPQTLPESGFYSYDVQLEVAGDPLPQNNRGAAFAVVSGDPRVLVISSDLAQDEALISALRAARLQVAAVGLAQFPVTLAEMQSFDVIFISNLNAGDIGTERQKMLESAVRDFGVGLVCVGGDQTYAAGGYRGTPLESVLPVGMELNSKKVLPSGAVVMIMHGMEFLNGNQVARDCAQGVLAALGPTDEMGVLLWDGSERWVFGLQKVGNKRDLANQIAGMNQGDLGSFQNVLEMAQGALNKSTAHLKHIIVFSDGDPHAPTAELMSSIVKDRITVSSILIAGHVGPETMIWLAENGHGRFYNITSPDELPQVFLKETAVILKSAIYEEPFRPQLRASTEPVRGIAATAYPQLLGYVATTPKPRAETPLWTENGDPLLAHWQYGLGRAVAFTSDARGRWGKNWLGWPQFRQFWAQVAQWSLRRTENAQFTSDLSIVGGEGIINLDAVDEQGNYRNFLNLQAALVGPKGDRQSVRLEQTAPGHYEARFPTKATGTYMVNVAETGADGVRASQVVGASVNYSPEFNASGPNRPLLTRLAELGGGRVLQAANASESPFLHDRVKTRQPRDLWEWLLRWAVLLFVADVAMRRVMIDRDEWARAWALVRKRIPLLNRRAKIVASTEVSLATLLSRRDQVRAQHPTLDPERPVTLPETSSRQFFPDITKGAPPLVAPEKAAASAPPAPPGTTPASTASRLLEAKRRAQQKPPDSPA